MSRKKKQENDIESTEEENEVIQEEQQPVEETVEIKPVEKVVKKTNKMFLFQNKITRSFKLCYEGDEVSSSLEKDDNYKFIKELED